MTETYAAAGVDIDLANQTVALIKKHVRSTFGPQVLGDIGLFGGLFHLQGYREPVLVASADGVGTKLKVAALLGRYHSLGLDIVHHCVNDILTCGAEPLFFMDYVAMGKLVPETVASLVSGMAEACRGVGCALLGGETAEMPGIYAPGDLDLVGFIVGAVERENVIDGRSILPGDVLLGLPSQGLHTNGYSLARRVFSITSQDPVASWDISYPELSRSLGEVLMEPHRCYYPLLKPVLPCIKGIAHITGGGLVDNVPRVLPDGLAARFYRGTWPVPAIFGLLQRRGDVTEQEMYRTFNMGLGMVLFCAEKDREWLQKAVPEAMRVGEVVERQGGDGVMLR